MKFDMRRKKKSRIEWSFAILIGRKTSRARYSNFINHCYILYYSLDRSFIYLFYKLNFLHLKINDSQRVIKSDQ